MIRGTDVRLAAQALVNVATAMNPGYAVAAQGVQAVVDLFQAKKQLDALFEKVMAETVATAPEIAQAVSGFYTTQSAALEAEFRARPGR